MMPFQFLLARRYWLRRVLPGAVSVFVVGAASFSAAAQAVGTPKTPPPAVSATKQPPAARIKPEDRARELTTSMKDALGLNTTQVNQIQEINLKSVLGVEEARQTYARQLPQMRAQIERIGNTRLSLIKGVLTEQQFRAYTAMREQKMGITDALKQQAKMSEAANGQ